MADLRKNSPDTIIEITEIRRYFPCLKGGKIYMNHAALSPLSQLVLDGINEFLIQRSDTNIENFLSVLDTTGKVKDKLSSMINTVPDRLAFVDNTSNGLNVLAQGLPWQSGDRILLNDIEFPSNIYPFLNLKPLGVEIDFVKSVNGVVSAEDVIAMITPRTRLISISQVQFLSGYRVDLKKIGEVCRQKGIVFSVDGIQGIGAVSLDVVEDKIDFLASGTQKWLMGLQGLGFIYITEELQDKLGHKYVGWTSVEDAWNLLNFDLTFKKSAECFQNGTLSAIGIIALNAALDLFYMYGLENVENAIIENSIYFMQQLQSLGIEPMLKDCAKENLSGIVSFNNNNVKACYEKLEANNIYTAMREGILRFSPHFYNTKEEIDKVINVLKSC